MGRETFIISKYQPFCENAEVYFEPQPLGMGPGNHHFSRVPSLDTDLRWTPEDIEEVGDDLVGVIVM